MDDLVQATTQSGEPWALIGVGVVLAVIGAEKMFVLVKAARDVFTVRRNGTAQGPAHVVELARQVEASADATTRLVDHVQKMETCLVVVKDTVQRIDRRTEGMVTRGPE